MGEGSNKVTMLFAIGVLIVSVSFMLRDKSAHRETKSTDSARETTTQSTDFRHHSFTGVDPELMEEQSGGADAGEPADMAMWGVPRGVQVASKMRNALFMMAGPGHALAPPPGAEPARSKQRQ